MFNVLGPLINPARPKGMVLGVAERELGPPFARSLARGGVERALVAALGGGCQLPLGAHCRQTADGSLELLACVTSLESDHEVRALGFGEVADPEALGEQVAERLLADGAGAILDDVREYDGPVP